MAGLRDANCTLSPHGEQWTLRQDGHFVGTAVEAYGHLQRSPERRLTSFPMGGGEGLRVLTAQPPAVTGGQDRDPRAGQALSGQHPPWAQGPRDKNCTDDVTKRNFQPPHPDPSLSFPTRANH